MVLWWTQLIVSPYREYLADGHDSFGRLRVINEDRVTVGNGFGFHHHQEFEIFSYMVRGELKQ